MEPGRSFFLDHDQTRQPIWWEMNATANDHEVRLAGRQQSHHVTPSVISGRCLDEGADLPPLVLTEIRTIGGNPIGSNAIANIDDGP